MVNEFDVLAEAGAQFAAIAAPLILKWIAENPYKKDVIINNKQFDPEEKLWDFYQNKMPKELAPKVFLPEISFFILRIDFLQG